jgi:formyltetrahydrofolate deformylase
VGIVAAVTGLLSELKGWIVESDNHADTETRRFFMRQEILAETLAVSFEGLRERMQKIAKQFEMTFTLTDTDVPKKVVILVSKQTHCLDDLLYRWRSGELPFQLQAVISNHEDSRAFVEWHKVPFQKVSMTDKDAGFQAIDGLFQKLSPDVIVLARFMQIMPPWMCDKYPGRIINIHHSFLPSFVGTKPYHQAHQRGVKYVGATCHYVTQQLDDGPIIEQDAFRTSHADTVEELIRTGRDVEKAVLARGLRYHLEDRVLLNGNKTVVFA